MATLWTSVFAFGALMWSCNGQTLQQIIEQREDLREFMNFIRDTEIPAVLRERDLKYTVFAPDNEAMRRIPRAVLQQLSGNSDDARAEKARFIDYHIVPPSFERGGPLNVADFMNMRVETRARNALKLFLRTFQVGNEWGYYVNGAQVISSDVDAQNGRIHIINSVLYPVATKDNAYSLIENMKQNTKRSESTSLFYSLLNEVRSNPRSPRQFMNSDSQFVTVFVPTDEALQKVLTRSRLEALMNDEDQLIDLLKRHVIRHNVSLSRYGNEGVKGVWHGALLNAFIDNAIANGESGYNKIDALEGHIKPVRIGNTLYVSNVCGMVKVMNLPERNYGEDGLNSPNSRENRFDDDDENEENNDDDYNNNYENRWTNSQQPAVYGKKFKVMSNLTVNNGVVHLVDGLMGYIYNDAIDMIREDDMISKFRDHILRSDSFVNKFTVRGATVPTKKYTIFAPINSAYANIERAGNIDMSQDPELNERVIGMHILNGQMSLTDFKNNERSLTLEGTQRATFNTDRYGTYVEVDRVRARIVRADVCVKNGIIHYIDNLLGVPYQNILDEVKSKDALLALNDLVDATPKFVEGNRGGLRPLTEILSEQTPVRTLFAPNLFAFNKMRTTQVGREFTRKPNSDKLYYLILRHAPVGEHYIEDDLEGQVYLPESDNLYVFKEDDDYFVEYRGEYGTVRAKILQRNLRMTNGVVHIIDSVLYLDNQQAFSVVGAASYSLPSLFLLTFCIFIKLFL